MRNLGLRIEDVTLAGWNLAGVPLIAAAGGLLAAVLSLGDAPNPAAGALQLAAVAGAVVAIATRPAGVNGAPPPPLRGAGSDGGRMAFIGPLAFAVAFVAGSASTYLGINVEGIVIAGGFGVITVAMVLGDRLPVIDARLRRALIFPFIAICAGIFNGFAADMLSGLEVGDLVRALTVDETGFGMFVIGMVLAGLAVFYAGLVVAPRVLIDPEPEHGCGAWPVRFALYVASAILGIGWLAVLAG